jgi:methionyl-tRNA synthetase
MFLLKVPKEKLYVWFDAPIGISSTKEWALREGKDWEPYWKDQDTKLVHFIGKDNIVFIHFFSDVESRRKLYFA